MSSDFESYEQDFAVLTADVTGRIAKVPKLLGDEKKQMVASVEKQLEEARELQRRIPSLLCKQSPRAIFKQEASRPSGETVSRQNHTDF